MRDEDADVDAENGCDDAEERDGRELADELDADEYTEEHGGEQRRAVHARVVVCVRRDVDGAEQRHRGRHVLL